MNEIKAIVVDDEKSARDILTRLIELHCPNVQIAVTCSNVPEAVEAVKEHQPDLLFLDIEMPNYAGYEIVSFFEEINFEIIFITAYDHYAIKAFEISAVDYLLKPVDISRLKVAVERFREKNELLNLRNSYQVLKESLTEKRIEKIVIPHNGEQKIILLKDILAIEAKEAYSTIHIKSGERFMVSKNLKHFEGLLDENTNFFRTHKSWLVNTDYMTSYSKSNFTICIEGDITAKLSKYRKAEFEQHLDKKN